MILSKSSTKDGRSIQQTYTQLAVELILKLIYH
jgi:hypothetical protein